MAGDGTMEPELGNALDPEGSGLLIMGKKRLVERMVRVTSRDPGGDLIHCASFPMDASAQLVFKSFAGGLVRPESASMAMLGQFHYGEGWFEGMRFYESPWGLVMVTPWKNYARALHSATNLHPNLARIIKELFDSRPDLQSVTCSMSLTPRNFYDLAEKCFRNKEEIGFPIELTFKDGRKETKRVSLMFNVSVGEGKTERLGMFDLDAIIKILAYVNRHVSADYFPPMLEMQEAGYIRPAGVVESQDGVKVPTVKVSKDPAGNTLLNFKPMELIAAPLPWKLYLSEEDYAKGLDILKAPYKRGHGLTEDAKMYSNYGYSMMAINMALMFGYGETASMNSDGQFVEGSAENVFAIMESGNRYVAYTPPTEHGCLPGTTRDNLMLTLDSMGVELIEPKFSSLSLRELRPAKGILLTGTGAQLIHVNSISELAAAEILAGMVRLRPESNGYTCETITREDFEPRTMMINNGEKHEMISRVQERHRERLTNDSSQTEPVYDLPDGQIAKLTEVDVKDFTTQQDRDDAKAGRFSERTRDTKELAYKHNAVARKITTAIMKSCKSGLKGYARPRHEAGTFERMGFSR